MTRLGFAGPLLLCGAVIRNAIRAAFEPRPETPVDPVQARMELARATATNDGRRAAFTLARYTEEPK